MTITLATTTIDPSAEQPQEVVLLWNKERTFTVQTREGGKVTDSRTWPQSQERSARTYYSATVRIIIAELFKKNFS